MNQPDYDAAIAELNQRALDIATAKRPGYTGASTDVLHNFKWVANALGLTPMQVWAVYFLKHVTAITSYAKDPSIPQAEALDGRFCDAKNYLDLGYGIMREGLTLENERRLSAMMASAPIG